MIPQEIRDLASSMCKTAAQTVDAYARRSRLPLGKIDESVIEVSVLNELNIKLAARTQVSFADLHREFGISTSIEKDSLEYLKSKVIDLVIFDSNLSAARPLMLIGFKLWRACADDRWILVNAARQLSSSPFAMRCVMSSDSSDLDWFVRCRAHTDRVGEYWDVKAVRDPTEKFSVYCHVMDSQSSEHDDDFTRETS
ncbi:MAG: hypothetical protein AB7I59_13535 [Geminicoccaceae bacterium]